MKVENPPAVPMVADFVLLEREGGYARGRAGYEQILRAAIDILIEEGYRALTMRRIARQCEMRPGHLSYYFKSKEELVRTLLESIIASYEREFDVIISDETLPPIQRLERLCILILEDIRSKKTTRIFPELWALSNHDPFVFERMHELYARARASLETLIEKINPSLPVQARQDLALFISSSMEGLTVFAGYEKPFLPRMLALEKIATSAFLHLVESYASDDE